MTSIKTGVDLVYIPRIKALIEGGDATTRLSKLYSPDEIEYCRTSSGELRYDRFAVRFAAKEAVLKTFGTGFSNGLYLRDIAIGHNDAGEPYVILSDKAQELFSDMGGVEISISLSHEQDYACAFAIARFER